MDIGGYWRFCIVIQVKQSTVRNVLFDCQMHRMFDVIADIKIVIVHHAPAFACSSKVFILLRSFSFARFVQATHAELIVYRKVSLQALQGLPAYLRSPRLAASIRGDITNTPLLLVVFQF
jgi:hypothetical protein